MLIISVCDKKKINYRYEDERYNFFIITNMRDDKGESLIINEILSIDEVGQMDMADFHDMWHQMEG